MANDIQQIEKNMQKLIEKRMMGFKSLNKEQMLIRIKLHNIDYRNEGYNRRKKKI